MPNKLFASVMIFNVWVFVLVDIVYFRGTIPGGLSWLAALVDVTLGIYLTCAVWKFETHA